MSLCWARRGVSTRIHGRRGRAPPAAATRHDRSTRHDVPSDRGSSPLPPARVVALSRVTTRRARSLRYVPPMDRGPDETIAALLSARARRVGPPAAAPPAEDVAINFDQGLPDPSLFPIDELRRCLDETLDRRRRPGSALLRRRRGPRDAVRPPRPAHRAGPAAVGPRRPPHRRLGGHARQRLHRRPRPRRQRLPRAGRRRRRGGGHLPPHPPVHGRHRGHHRAPCPSTTTAWSSRSCPGCSTSCGPPAPRRS